MLFTTGVDAHEGLKICGTCLGLKAFEEKRKNGVLDIGNHEPDERSGIVEDVIKLLDGVSNGLRRGRYPEKGQGAKIAQVLRRVADDLEG